MSGEPDQYWLVYVRWASGLRETIRTRLPKETAALDRLVVRAIVAEPRVAVDREKGFPHVYLARG